MKKLDPRPNHNTPHTLVGRGREKEARAAARALEEARVWHVLRAPPNAAKTAKRFARGWGIVVRNADVPRALELLRNGTGNTP